MSRIVYVNGRYLPYAEAQIHVEDRGFQFADAVYEVIEVRSGQLIDLDRHIARLERSLAELKIQEPMSTNAMLLIIAHVVGKNRVQNGLAYLQVTRGIASRDFLFPTPPVRPTFVCLARSQSRQHLFSTAQQGISVITLPDNRWGRCDIKTVMLLPACLAKEQARCKGATEAWFYDNDGLITEGASSNAWIVDRSGHLRTRALGNNLLPGITRSVLLELIRAEGVELQERPFSPPEAKSASEAFITSATNTVMPVVKIDGSPIGNGKPGPLTSKFRAIYQNNALTSGNCDQQAKVL